ncbi:MAG: ImcF-related family protein, partial [Candidatus Binatia bacterium]
VDDNVGATTVTAILTRKNSDASLIDGSYQVPGAYTRPGYDLMQIAILEANEKLSEDDWVMGESGKSAVATSTDASDIATRYDQDYADNWKKFIQGVSVKTYKDKNDASTALQTFSDASSPMKTLLAEVARNTNLSAKPDNQGWWDWIKSFFTSKKASGTGGNTEPEKQFRPLFDFVGTKNQKDAPVDKYQTEIGKVFKNISGISQDEFIKDGQAMAADGDPLAIRKSETNISNLIKGFSVTPSGAEIATLLQKPLGNLKDLMGSGTKQQIAKAWSDQILPAAKEIEKGYPYDDTDADVDLTKLTAYLNPNDGSFSKFYKDKLEKYFEESNGQLKVKDSADIKDFTPEFVTYLNNIVALRKAMFGTSATPKFEYEFAFKPVAGAIVEVAIDGQTLDSSGTSALKGVFPAPSGSQIGAVIKLGSASGPAPAAPAASNSAPSSKPSSPSGEGALTFPGTWGLFKFVNAGKPQKQASGEYLLSYSIGGKSVSATIKPSGGDLFDKGMFRNAKAPPTLFK